MKAFKPFNFNKRIDNIDIMQRLCIYHNEANNALGMIDNDKKESLCILKDIFHSLRDEVNEYNKVKYSNIILNNKLYSIYCTNLKDAYSHCDGVNSYINLSPNLCNIVDYTMVDFFDLFPLHDDKFIFDKNKIEDYLYNNCCIELKNYNLYIGKVEIKLTDPIQGEVESVSVLMQDNWYQLPLNEINRIIRIDDLENK